MDELSHDKDLSLEASIRSAPKDMSPPVLKAAVRRARVEEAERSDVLAELRGSEIARLEMLHEALAPVLDEVPKDADIFDVGLMPTAHPRLFIDMIGFIEMGRDRRLYRFVQDTKHGRVTLAESEKINVMVKAVTDYIARRLVEREKALAADAANATQDLAKTDTKAVATGQAVAASEARKSSFGFNQILGFTIELLGSMLLFALVTAGFYQFFTFFSGWLTHLSTH